MTLQFLDVVFDKNNKPLAIRYVERVEGRDHMPKVNGVVCTKKGTCPGCGECRYGEEHQKSLACIKGHCPHHSNKCKKHYKDRRKG